jgi:predicted amino acid-binding ACT domain protein
MRANFERPFLFVAFPPALGTMAGDLNRLGESTTAQGSAHGLGAVESLEQRRVSETEEAMDFRLNRIQVWSGELPDRAGGVAEKLEPLAQAGANLEFIWSRRLLEKPGWGVLFVAPITGAAQTKAAQTAGLHKDNDMILLRIEGTDAPGVGHSLAACLARAGINLRGMSMTAIAGRFVAYVYCDNPEDAAKAVQALAAFQTG